ncbi:hypothetical protein [Magnetospirillum aberrantis]|uniref:Uncharacterized protein n=1 Tax=Magnetospirillum aberrantis SpK TaxID=908842 RepID=A0A7C9UW66_9PROT|nr:hypothetical protein [Magnetospirillum aberrantis]NFV81908.1 hypothetical protein [Magnetospirillum aberrantis SpK]
MNAPNIHLLLWDAEREENPDDSAYAQATDDGRVLFRQLWAKNSLSPKMLMDDPATDADTTLDGLIRFLRHSVAVGYAVQPIIADDDALLTLKLTADDERLMFFPQRIKDSQPAPLEDAAAVMVAAATIQEIEEAEAHLVALYGRLHHLFRIGDREQISRLRAALVHCFSGGDFPQDGDQ